MALQRSLTEIDSNSEKDPTSFFGSENVTKALFVGDAEYEMTVCRQDNDGTNAVEITATFFGLVIAILNIFVLIVIIRNKNLHKATYFCICNLAAADLLAGLLLLWIFCLQKLLPFRSPLSDLVQKNIWTVSLWASLLSQVVIAIDKFCLIRKRLVILDSTWGNPKRKRWIIFGLLMTWLIPIFTFVVPVSATWNCANNCECYIPVNGTTDVIYMFCFPFDKCSLTNPPFTKSSMLYIGLFLVAMPIVPCVLYMKIFNRARMSAKRLHPNPPKNSIPTNSRDQEIQTLRGSATFPSHSGYYASEYQNLPSINNKDEFLGSTSQNLSVPSHSPSKSHFGGLLKSQENIAAPSLSAKKTSRKSSSKKLVSIVNALKIKPASSDSSPPSISPHQTEKRRSNFNLRKSSSAFLIKTFNIGTREVSLLRTLIIILGCYFVSTVPLGVLFVISYQDTDKRYVTPAKGLLILSLVNSFLNPMIYIWRFKEMRKGIKNMFGCLRS